MIKFLPTIDAPADTKLPQRSTQFLLAMIFTHRQIFLFQLAVKAYLFR